MTATNMCSNFGGKWDSRPGGIRGKIFFFLHIYIFYVLVCMCI